MTSLNLTSRSEFLRVRGLRYHLRRWGDARLPLLFLGHGFLDVSATFEPLVAPLLDRWQVIAPDWRGFGHTEWPQEGYWFHDYVADLEAIGCVRGRAGAESSAAAAPASSIARMKSPM